MRGPLTGVRVIDLSQMFSGPVATAQLADQGADVVKIEPPGVGDQLRALPSFSKGGMNSAVATVNRGKRSIVLDFANADGLEIAKKLIAGSDVVVQNFRPGVMTRIGLDLADLRRLHPKLITTSISGYGLTGPLSHLPVFDPIIQGITGHVAVQVNPEIPFPDLVRNAVVDKATAAYVAQAVTAALFRREKSGEGQHIDISMIDASLNFFWPDGMQPETLLDGDVTPGRTLAETYSLTECADGKVIYFAGTFEQGMRLFAALGHPEWCEDERFNSIESLFENLELLGGMIREAFAKLSVNDAVSALNEGDIPCGQITSIADVPKHPQIVATKSIVEFEHPVAGRVRQPVPAARFSSTPSDPSWILPMPGDHTDEILSAAGFDIEEIASFRESGAVA